MTPTPDIKKIQQYLGADMAITDDGRLIRIKHSGSDVALVRDGIGYCRPSTVTANHGCINLSYSGTRDGAQWSFPGSGTTQGSGGYVSYLPRSATPHYLFVADYNHSKVVKFTSAWKYIDDVVFPQPKGIATDGTYIYVTSESHLIAKYDLDLTLISQIGSFGTGNDQFKNPTGICTDGEYLWIVDSINARIQKRLCADLSFVSKIGSYQVGTWQDTTTDHTPGSFTYYNIATGKIEIWVTPGAGDFFASPQFIYLYGESVYIADTHNYRIQKRDAESLAYIAEYTHTDLTINQYTPLTPQQMAIGFIGIAGINDYLYGMSGNITIKISPNAMAYADGFDTSTPGKNWLWAPQGFAVNSQYVWIADKNNHRLVRRNLEDMTYSSELGDTETALDSPYGITNDGTYLYILDSGNHRVLKYTLNYDFVAEFGNGQGSGDDQLDYPDAICIIGGYVYIADSGNDRIMKLTDALVFVDKLGSTGSGNDQFNYLSGICTDGSFLYCTDWSNHRIVKRNLNLSYHSQIGAQGSGDDQFNGPAAISTDNTFLYVSDFNNKRIVKRLNSDLSYVNKVSSFHGGDTFENTYGSATDGTTLYVCDAIHDRIITFQCSDLAYLAEIGSTGSGDDQFDSIDDCTLLNTKIFVADAGNNRIVKRNADTLSYIEEFAIYNYSFSLPYDVCYL